MGVEIQLNAMVTDVDYMGLTVKEKDGTVRRIECRMQGVVRRCTGQPARQQIAEQSDGTQCDRAGRVVVEPDLCVKGHPNVFVIGDMMCVPGVPGHGPRRYPRRQVRDQADQSGLNGEDPTTRKPFKYLDKGSMATISRFNGVCQVGKLEFGGFLAWLAWLGLHLFYLVGGRNRLDAVISWFITFFGRGRGQMAITERWSSREMRWINATSSRPRRASADAPYDSAIRQVAA